METNAPTSPCKLNLGCGSDVRPGYTNVDKYPISAEVVQAELPTLPFADTINFVASHQTQCLSSKSTKRVP